MMSTQLLNRGRSLGTKCCSSRISSSSSSFFSTRADVNTESDGSNDAPPPIKKHPQSFVQSDIELDLGELETELPRGFHQDGGKGMGQYRHANDGRDSYWRPPWRESRAEIISAEDFANRPRVTFSESFLTMHDAMAVLSWQSQEEKDGMYKLYIDMMMSISEQGKNMKMEEWGVLTTNTSHEYIVRVVAQKYNVTTSRAAGVIQLQHNEEQLKGNPKFKVNHALQAHMDMKMREHIKEVYGMYREKEPIAFVEEPLASTGRIKREDQGSNYVLGSSELIDVDHLLKKTKMQETEAAKMRIANHIYVEDVDERTRKVKLDDEARRCLKMNDNLDGAMREKWREFDEDYEGGDGSDESTDRDDNAIEAKDTDASAESSSDVKEEEEKLTEELASKSKVKVPPKSVRRQSKKGRVKIPKNLKIPAAATPYPDNNRGYNEQPETRRPRWKFAAQIINTHDMEANGKVKARRAKGKKHGRIVDGNTIIEQDGELRVASVAELEQTSWKHVRDTSEIMFKGVKEAWMRRQLEGEVGGWGFQQEVDKPEAIEAKDEEGEEKEEGEEGDEDASEGEGETDKKDDKE